MEIRHSGTTLILFCLALCAPALLAVPVEYVRHDFNYGSKGPRGRVHVVRPSMNGTDSERGHEWLERVADFVWADAEKHGFLNDNTREAYRDELRLVREGRWPTIFATDEGETKILQTLSFAIRWDAHAALPFERRFFGRGIAELPTEPLPVSGTWAQIPRFLKFFEARELLYQRNYFSMLGFMLMRYSLLGEKAELKFLASADDRQARHYLFAIQKTLSFHEIPIWSRRPIPPPAWRTFHHIMREYGAVELAKEALAAYRLDAPPDADPARLAAIERWIRERVVSAEWQPYVMNQRIFVHVSGPARGLSMEAARTRYFIRHLGFPSTPQWSFLEDEKIGTPGIRTDIFEMSPLYYDAHVTNSLRDMSLGDIEPLDRGYQPYVARESPVAYLPSCGRMLSEVEQDLAAYLQIRF